MKAKNNTLMSPKYHMNTDNLVLSSAKNPQRTESKHRQIVEGACKVFFEKGYNPTTIREIAAACDMSMGQLYHYVSSKDDILFMVYRHMQQLWQDMLTFSGIEAIEDPLEKLRHALLYSIDFIAKNKKLFFFVYTETKYLNKRHLKAVLQIDNQYVVGFWRRILRDVKNQKAIEGDTDYLANILSYLLLFLPLRGWNLRGRPAKRNLQEITEFIMRGLGVEG